MLHNTYRPTQNTVKDMVGDVIVIYRLGSLGDTVVALPCFHAIERAFPCKRKIVLTNVPVSSKAAALEVVLSNGGFIDGVISYPVGVRNPLKLFSLWKKLRSLNSDTLIYLSSVRSRNAIRRDEFFFKICGFKHIVGLPEDEDRRTNRLDPYGVVENEADRLARNIESLGSIDLEDRLFWDLRLTQEELTAGKEALTDLQGAQFLAINLGGKAAEKDWGDNNWRLLLAKINPNLTGWGIVAIGGAEDKERSDWVLSDWIGPKVNLCGLLNPREGAAAMSAARFFVGHDSGPLHLAASTGVPTCGLFGGYNTPNQWHPYGENHRTIHHMGGMAGIAVSQVAAAALTLAGKV